MKHEAGSMKPPLSPKEIEAKNEYRLRIQEMSDPKKEWAADGQCCVVRAASMAELNRQLEEQLGLVGVEIQLFDVDFEEWYAPSSIEDVPMPDAIIKLRAAGKIAAVELPPVRRARDPSPGEEIDFSPRAQSMKQEVLGQPQAEPKEQPAEKPAIRKLDLDPMAGPQQPESEWTPVIAAKPAVEPSEPSAVSAWMKSSTTETPSAISTWLESNKPECSQPTAETQPAISTARLEEAIAAKRQRITKLEKLQKIAAETCGVKSKQYGDIMAEYRMERELLIEAMSELGKQTATDLGQDGQAFRDGGHVRPGARRPQEQQQQQPGHAALAGAAEWASHADSPRNLGGVKDTVDTMRRSMRSSSSATEAEAAYTADSGAGSSGGGSSKLSKLKKRSPLGKLGKNKGPKVGQGTQTLAALGFRFKEAGKLQEAREMWGRALASDASDPLGLRAEIESLSQILSRTSKPKPGAEARIHMDPLSEEPLAPPSLLERSPSADAWTEQVSCGSA